MGTVPEEAEMCFFFVSFLRCFAALKSKCLSHIQVNGLSEFGILCFYQLCKVNQCDDRRSPYLFLLVFNLVYLNKNPFLLGKFECLTKCT